MRRDTSDREAAHRLRCLGVWLGIVPAVLCAIPGIGLLLLPMLERLPQQDRPYGWLFDRLAPVVGSGLLVAALAFAALASALFARARRTQPPGG
jgi:hypothetical protein